MSFPSVVAELEALLNRPDLFDEAALGPRSAAIDFLRFAAGMIRAYERSHGVTIETQHLCRQATNLEHELSAVDQAFFSRIRDRIRSGELVGPKLRGFCDRFTGYEPRDEAHLHLSLDPLDTLVVGVLHTSRPPQPMHPLEPEMIPYQPSPVSALLELVDRARVGPEDIFLDLGSGLGDAVTLVHLLTGAHARGVEIDPGLCTYAQEASAALGLDGVTYVNADARVADLGDGTVFYLFTPFMGDLLTDVMTKLRQVAQNHRIRIGTYGPMTPVVAGLTWLRSLNVHHEDPFRLAVFESSATAELNYSS